MLPCWRKTCKWFTLTNTRYCSQTVVNVVIWEGTSTLKLFACEYAKYPAFQRGNRLYLAISSKLIKLLHRATVQSLKGHHILIITYVGGHTADYPIPTVVTREVALALFPHTRFHVKVVGWALRKFPLRAASPC